MTSSVSGPGQTRLDALHERLASHSLLGLWQRERGDNTVQPRLWRWSDVLPCLLEAGDIAKALELQLELQRFQATLGPLRAYGRGVTMVGLQLRGFPVKEFPRWPTRPMPPTDVELLRAALKSGGALPVTV